MPPEILICAAFAVACMLAVIAEDRLIRRLTRDTPAGETAGCCAECDGWDGYGPW